MRVRTRLILATVALMLLSAVLPAVADPASEKAAHQAATRWLALVDAGKYEQSWKEMAPLMRQTVTAAQWATSVKGSRGPVGPLKERKLLSATFTRQVPGTPVGKYVVLFYQSKWAHRQAFETVTPMLCPDGKWRVAGYTLR